MSAAAPPSHHDLPPPESPSSVQPGGFGLFVRMELCWGQCRRALLRRFQKQHVERWLKKRRGHCEHFTDAVIDPRDLKFIRNVCGYWFDPADDVYRRREALGFARYGFAELVGWSLLLVGVGAAAASVLAVVVHGAFLALSFVLVFLWLEVLWFFRDPERTVPTDPQALISPADGTVSHVETVDEPGFGPNTLRISIFLSIFNVHVNRIPRAGKVERVSYFRGSFLDARHAECARRNEQLWVDFVGAEGTRFRVKQIAGAIARRIVCWLRNDEEVATGQRYGMIKFGSRTDLLIPADCVTEVRVKVGDKVRGGVTILGSWAALTPDSTPALPATPALPG